MSFCFCQKDILCAKCSQMMRPLFSNRTNDFCNCFIATCSSIDIPANDSIVSVSFEGYLRFKDGEKGQCNISFLSLKQIRQHFKENYLNHSLSLSNIFLW